MKTQRSRNSFDPSKRYSGVYQQQGRMLTDADWNELSELLKERLNSALVDVIGSGTPRGRGIITESTSSGTTTYELGWGHVYIDGIAGEFRPAADAPAGPVAGVRFEYENQADFPSPPELPASGMHELYLDLWERAVTSLEDPDLADPALHGADTCTRTQTMVQLKWREVPEAGAAADNPAIGAALLTLALREAATEPDPCDPCAQELDLTREPGNYLFRVEVHDVEYQDGLPARVTLKWSSEGGAEQYVVGLEPAGFKDGRHTFEFFSGADSGFASEKHLGHHLHGDPAWSPVRGELHASAYPDTLPASFPNVRRWDGSATFLKSGSSWTLVEGNDFDAALSTSNDADAHAQVTEGPAPAVNLDALGLTLELADHHVLAGDYWEVAVRSASAGSPDPLLENEPPAGILHHYLTLGTEEGDAFTPASPALCRQFQFPPLTDLAAEDVCYDNTVCEMPGVDTVKDALDHLCRERDLRWHNKHLHGWGVVCGLQLHCAPEKTNSDSEEDAAARRRQIRVRSGYALDCEGNDLVLEQTKALDLVSRVEAHDQEAEVPILTDGDGTACLSIGHDRESGEIAFGIEKYGADRGDLSSLLEGTLLWDFYQQCIVKLVEALKSELDFTDVSDRDDGSNPKVSPRRRLLVSLMHLALQFLYTTHGRYIFISKNGHNLLEGFYERLRALLKSETFCAMFELSKFPEYPLDTGMRTAFGKNSHTELLAHPSGEFVYSYGGANKWINVYDTAKGELVAVHEMPAPQGAEIRALAISDDGKRLYAAASLHDDDSLYAFAEVDGEKLAWRASVVLCDVLVTEMAHAREDGLVWAVGKGKGLYELRHSVIFGEEKQRPEPRFSFNAVRHLALDDQALLAYATAAGEEDGLTDVYDELAILDLGAAASSNQDPTGTIPLRHGNERFEGKDGFTLGTQRRGSQAVHVVVTPRKAATRKHLLTLTVSGLEAGNSTLLEIENTVVTPAYHPAAKVVLLALSGSFRLQAVSEDGRQIVSERIPVQVQPQALAVHEKHPNVYALNFLSNTVSVVPTAELKVPDDFNQKLAAYRMEVILAFLSLVSGTLQYLKDCFCQRLLVDCPRCGEDDKVFLGVVEIRGSEVYKICNFAKRRNVHTFPKVEYWLSLVPVIPLLNKAVEKFCCLILPDTVASRSTKLAARISDEPLTESQAASTSIPAGRTTAAALAFQRTDFKAERLSLQKQTGVAAKLQSDNLLAKGRATSPARSGIKKTALVDADTEAAKSQLTSRGINIASVREYDPADATQLKAYRGTPSRVPKGAEVDLYEKDGKVVFYALREKPAVLRVGEATKAELDELERRKIALADFSGADSELARIETKRAELADVAALKSEIEKLDDSKDGVERNVLALKEDLAALRAERDSLAATQPIRTELAGLKSELAALHAERTAEESKIAALKTEREAQARELVGLREDLLEVRVMREDLARDITRHRPVTKVPDITTPVANHLRTLEILTVEDLAEATPQKIALRQVLSEQRAAALIANAKEILK